MVNEISIFGSGWLKDGFQGDPGTLFIILVSFNLEPYSGKDGQITESRITILMSPVFLSGIGAIFW